MTLSPTDIVKRSDLGRHVNLYPHASRKLAHDTDDRVLTERRRGEGMIAKILEIELQRR